MHSHTNVKYMQLSGCEMCVCVVDFLLQKNHSCVEILTINK